MAVEKMMLSKLDQNTSYDFLDGQTPAQISQQLKDQKKIYHELAAQFPTAYSQMSPDEMVNYSERIKIYGEVDAIKWLIQQHPPADAAK